MMTQRNHKTNLMALIAVLALTLVSGAESAASEVVELANGITLTVFSAEEIRINPAVTGISLITHDNSYVPFDRDEVVQALETMHGFDIDMDVTVYLLPSFPTKVNSSYARGNEIFLAPGTGIIPASTQAYITTHEMGHVLTWAFMDNSATRWEAFMELRGLDYELNGPSAPHADRAREIVAEDFRFLFGGPLSIDSGSIENHHLDLPTEVEGLHSLMAGFLVEKALPIINTASAKAFPNPCNPRTTIEMELSAGTLGNGSVRLSIYDIRGNLVRTINDGQVNGSRVAVAWNGDNSQGQGVASGRYFYVIQTGDLKANGSVTLVR
jgi:FlgD Ig-like domain